MKNRENERYFKWGLTGMAIAAFGILLYFLLLRSHSLAGVMGLLGKILRPFGFGAVIAYLVMPLSRALERLLSRVMKPGSARGLANVLALVIAILVVLAVIMLIVPQLINSIVEIVRAAPAQYEALVASLQDEFASFTKANPEYAQEATQMVNDAFGAVEKYLTANFGTYDAIMNTLTPVVTGAASSVGSLVGTMKDLLIGLIVSLYLLSRRSQLAAQANLIVHGIFKPEWADWLVNETRFADRMFNGFFVGKLIDSAIVGALCFIGCLVMGFKSSLLIATIVGVTNIIPFFGPFIGAVPCALLLLLENPMHCLMFLVFVIILQQLDGNVIGPKILGDSTGLSALWVMFGILLFGGLWGIPGMLVGVPLMAVIYDIIRQIAHNGLRSKGLGVMIDAYNACFHPAAPEKKKK